MGKDEIISQLAWMDFGMYSRVFYRLQSIYLGLLASLVSFKLIELDRLTCNSTLCISS